MHTQHTLVAYFAVTSMQKKFQAKVEFESNFLQYLVLQNCAILKLVDTFYELRE